MMSNDDSDNRKAIWEAACNGDWEAVKQWLEQSPPLIDVTGEFFLKP